MLKKEEKEKKDLQIKFGQHLKKLRIKAGITGAELARRCYVERHHILRLERGETNPTLYTLKKVSDALKISLEKILRGFRY